MTSPRGRRLAAISSRLALISSIGFAATIALPAHAQVANTAPTADAETEAAADDIVVKGSRPIKESQEAALKTQKESDSLVSVISSDAVGRLPDQNIAQAVGRLPGVGVVRDQGQARYVNLRGAPINWTTLSFDGINVISPEGRDARFDSIPSAIAAQIIVKKAVTPDLTAETIAGNINIVTRSPFDYKGFHAALRSSFGKNDLGNGNEFEETMVLSNRWNTSYGEVGLLVSGTYYSRDMATDNFETDWETVPRDLRPVAAGEPQRVWARETENKLYRLTRRNYSGSARLEWKPDDNNRIFGTSIYSAFTDNELRSNYIFDFDDQEARVPNLAAACPATPFLAPNTTGYADVCAGNTPFVGVVRGIDINHNALSREFLQSVFVNTLGGDHEFGEWNVSWRANYTQSIDDRSAPAQINYDSPGFGTNGATAINRPTVAYDLTNPQLARVQLFRTLRAADGTLSAGAAVRQIEDFPLALSRIRSLAAVDTTDAYSAKVDVIRKTDILGDTKVQFGMQYDNRVKAVDESLLDVNAATATLAGVPSGVAAISIADPFKGKLPRGYDFFYFGKDQINGLVDRVRPFGSFVRSTANFYEVRERVVSGYIKGTTTFDWGNVVYGVRVEGVNNSAQAFSQNPVAGQPVTLINVGSGFISAYPSIHANWNVTDEHKIRLSLNTGAARPDYPVLRPNFTFNDANMTVSGGNPNATPERTRGVDLYYEYYPKFGGFFSVGIYYKDVQDVLFQSTRIFNSDVLDVAGTDRSNYVFSTTVNGGSGRIYGAEAALQFQLGDLLKNDSWIGGFGFQGNITLNRSTATTPDGRKVRLPGASDVTFNVGPYYEKYGFSVRAQYQYRTDYIDSLGDPTVGGDFFWATDDELDVSARYSITKNFEVYVDASNLLNGPGRRFVGIRQRSIERETFGRRYTGGVRVTF